MGFFENLLARRRPDRQAEQTFQFVTGYSPAFRGYQGAVYESELIRSSLDAHGRHCAKLKVEFSGSAAMGLKRRMRARPNPWQTWPKFLYQAAVVLYAKNNLFLVPVYDEFGLVIGIQIVVPVRFELVQSAGGLWVRFYLKDGGRAAERLEMVGIVTRFQVDDQLFGEDNRALKDTLDLQAIQRQGIEEAVKNGASYRFYGRSSNWSKDSDLAKERKRFNELNFQNGEGGGLLLFPNTVDDIHQAVSRPYTVDAAQQNLIRTNVFDYFGTNEEVLQNKAKGDEWAAFYEGGPEWFAVNLGDALTGMLFSERERTAGNEVLFSSNRLQYMTTAEKLNYVNSMGDRGLITRNEARAVFNLAPLPEPYGDQIMARGEYYNINDKKDDADLDDNEPDGGKNADGSEGRALMSGNDPAVEGRALEAKMAEKMEG